MEGPTRDGAEKRAMEVPPAKDAAKKTAAATKAAAAARAAAKAAAAYARAAESLGGAVEAVDLARPVPAHEGLHVEWDPRAAGAAAASSTGDSASSRDRSRSPRCYRVIITTKPTGETKTEMVMIERERGDKG